MMGSKPDSEQEIDQGAGAGADAADSPKGGWQAGVFGSEEGYGWLVLLILAVVVGLVLVVGILVRRGRVGSSGARGPGTRWRLPWRSSMRCCSGMRWSDLI